MDGQRGCHGKIRVRHFKGEDLPVETISWHDCESFLEKLNSRTGLSFRLPTTAEWLFTARGGNYSKGFVYAGSNQIEDIAWYKKNSNKTTHPVGKKLPNELGLYDMHGNVFEWCSDNPWRNTSTIPSPFSTHKDYKLLLGGAYNFGKDQLRTCESITEKKDNYGIRLFHDAILWDYFSLNQYEPIITLEKLMRK